MGYTYTISCRMSDEDRIQLLSQAEKLELSPSNYLRYLIRIPVGIKDSEAAKHCVVVDTSTLEDLKSELTKWGYHYNQAVHAMNTIAMFVRRGRVDYQHLDANIRNIESQLIRISAECKELQDRVELIEGSVLIGGK